MLEQVGAVDIYERLGGASGCRALSSALYARIDRDPLVRPLFPGKTLHCAIEEFAAFLVQFLGGPSKHSQRRWRLSLHQSHLRARIRQEHRDAWLRNMYQALDDVHIDEPLRGQLRTFFETSSPYLINDGPAKPATLDVPKELHASWQTQLVTDQAIAAVKACNADRAVELTEACARYNRSLSVGLFMEMVASGLPELVAYVREKILADTTLPSERFAGRTFLHVAAAVGNVELVELLLHLGIDSDIADGGGHTPLYAVANQCTAPAGANIVRTLIKAGATVDACDGVQRCTPLHMAARRDNVDVAAALLDHGASIDARDRSGDTPLRRAVNCSQSAVAALLLARGADPDSIGSRGLTPKSAARTAALRSLFSK